MEENEIILEQILKKGEMQKEQTTYDYQGTMSSDDSEHKNNLPANTDGKNITFLHFLIIHFSFTSLSIHYFFIRTNAIWIENHSRGLSF